MKYLIYIWLVIAIAVFAIIYVIKHELLDGESNLKNPPSNSEFQTNNVMYSETFGNLTLKNISLVKSGGSNSIGQERDSGVEAQVIFSVLEDSLTAEPSELDLLSQVATERTDFDNFPTVEMQTNRKKIEQIKKSENSANVALYNNTLSFNQSINQSLVDSETDTHNFENSTYNNLSTFLDNKTLSSILITDIKTEENEIGKIYNKKIDKYVTLVYHKNSFRQINKKDKSLSLFKMSFENLSCGTLHICVDGRFYDTLLPSKYDLILYDFELHMYQGWLQNYCNRDTSSLRVLVVAPNPGVAITDEFIYLFSMSISVITTCRFIRNTTTTNVSISLDEKSTGYNKFVAILKAVFQGKFYMEDDVKFLKESRELSERMREFQFCRPRRRSCSREYYCFNRICEDENCYLKCL